MISRSQTFWLLILICSVAVVLLWSTLPVSANDTVPLTVELTEKIIASQAPTAIVVTKVKANTSPLAYLLVLQAALVVMGTVLTLMPGWRDEGMAFLSQKFPYSRPTRPVSPSVTTQPLPSPSSPLAVAPSRNTKNE